jgi:hypothetical protein
MKFLTGYTDFFFSPVTGLSSVLQPLPDLERGYVWMGDEENRPLPTYKLIDLKIDVLFLQKQIDAFETMPFVINTPVPSLKKAQVLSALDDGILKNAKGLIEIAVPNTDYLTPSLKSGNIWLGNDKDIASPQARIALGNLPELEEGKLWLGDKDKQAQPVLTINLDNLPKLTQSKIWVGDENNRPIESDFTPASNEATYIIQIEDASLKNAQVLNDLGAGMAKIVTGGAFALAIPDEDYATKETLEKLAQEAQQSAEEAAASAEEAAGSATEASGAATEATGAAAEATGAAGEASLSAGAASISAIAAAASALGASGSASSASSSASDASDSASKASDSAKAADQSAQDAATSLNKLLTTPLTLTGVIQGSGLLSAPIPTVFKENPVLPGKAAMTLPQGTSADRPQQLVPGMLRYNSTPP